jgi:succinate dehydrogenase / fumarate reductase cytochrome b subunit
MKQSRPKYLNLTEIKLPMPAFVSILHRVSGVGLYLVGIPLALWMLQTSLASESGYASVAAAADSGFVKLVLLGLLWAFLHHLCAGIRFLALDLHLGDDLQRARGSSAAVLVVSLVLTAILGAKLW